jgi:DNA-binding transcriptional MocR family regulator
VAADLIAGVLTGGSYRKHMEQVRQRLTVARQQVGERLAALGLIPWLMPRGGFYLWCRLPDGYDSADLARRCLSHKVIMAPGNVFSVSRSAGSFLRFNVAQMADPRVFTVLQQAMTESARAQGDGAYVDRAERH